MDDADSVFSVWFLSFDVSVIFCCLDNSWLLSRYINDRMNVFDWMNHEYQYCTIKVYSNGLSFLFKVALSRNINLVLIIRPCILKLKFLKIWTFLHGDTVLGFKKIDFQKNRDCERFLLNDCSRYSKCRTNMIYTALFLFLYWTTILKFLTIISVFF